MSKAKVMARRPDAELLVMETILAKPSKGKKRSYRIVSKGGLGIGLRTKFVSRESTAWKQAWDAIRELDAENELRKYHSEFGHADISGLHYISRYNRSMITSSNQISMGVTYLDALKDALRTVKRERKAVAK